MLMVFNQPTKQFMWSCYVANEHSGPYAPSVANILYTQLI